ncbi:MAG: hypothetical protein M1829_005121 [Trizodia sp. TS-e1964]|nr:MAG: hypothetical protein M1829_005121 [Trizodia sp. TS-e1964]
MSAALTGQTASVRIPKPRDNHPFSGRDTFAGVAARSITAKNQGNMLMTPPNSISPPLPPQGFQACGSVTTGSSLANEHVDSDIDLQDATTADLNTVDQTAQALMEYSTDGHETDSPGHDSAGTITPALLAKYHLPEILLAHGPLAIRHVMGYLTTSVPGFSGIPPAKARRLVVGALEGRGSGLEIGGANGEVEFEKVGWGRWDAKLKGQQRSRDRQGTPPASMLSGNPSPPPSMPSSLSGMAPLTNNSSNWADRGGSNATGTSWAGDSIVYSHDDEMEPICPEGMTMLDNEADKMSLDGDGSCSSSEAPEETPMADDDFDDDTDDEDWASIGAAALRQAYCPTGRNRTYLSTNLYTGGGGGPSTLALARSVPLAPVLNMSATSGWAGFTQNPEFGVGSDSQEREAIEALVRLSSV